jgi:hypothetical protein
MTPRKLRRIFEWFTTAELLLARTIIFFIFLFGLWQLFLRLK